jgi:CSLREA domain-containing protein
MNDISQRSGRARLLAANVVPLVCLLMAGLLLQNAERAQAAPGPFTFIVNSNADIPDQTLGNGVCDVGIPGLCTLRAAVQESNASQGPGNTIVLQANTTYTLVRAGIDSNALNGDLDVGFPVTITGAGPTSTIINANGNTTNDRAFEVNANVVISGVAIINGMGATAGGGIRAVNANNLWLFNTIVRDNAVTGAGGHGGGIYNEAHITMTHSAVLSNTAAGDGGGFYGNFGSAYVVDSTFGWNTAGGDGGGIYQTNGIVSLLRNTLRNNRARYGGGIAKYTGQFDLINSTMSGNTATSDGGGIYIAKGDMDVSNATIAENTANSDGTNGGFGGGIATPPTATITVKNSIIAANGHRNGLFYFLDDCAGPITAVAYNIFASLDSSHCAISGSYTVTNPMLLPLGNHGGATETYALAASSPAIDAASGCFDLAGQPLLTDQRGKPRPALGGTGRCDIGAFEFNYVAFLPVIRR